MFSQVEFVFCGVDSLRGTPGLRIMRSSTLNLKHTCFHLQHTHTPGCGAAYFFTLSVSELFRFWQG